MQIKSKYLIGIIILLILVFPLSAQATPRHKASMREVRHYMRRFGDMPVYCQCRMTEREITEVGVRKIVPEKFAYSIKRWKEKMGDGAWRAFPHYCFGIRRYRNAIMMIGSDKATKIKRTSMLNWALSEFSSFRPAIDDEFPLWANMLYYEAQIFIQLGRYDLANVRKRQMMNFKKNHRKK